MSGMPRNQGVGRACFAPLTDNAGSVRNPTLVLPCGLRSERARPPEFQSDSCGRRIQGPIGILLLKAEGFVPPPGDAHMWAQW